MAPLQLLEKHSGKAACLYTESCVRMSGVEVRVPFDLSTINSDGEYEVAGLIG